MWKRVVGTLIVAYASIAPWAAYGSDDHYPKKPIRVLLGSSPGGGDDYQARILGPKLTERFGQSIVIENRPGATGNQAVEITARANPDGYTLSLASMTGLSASPSLYSKLGYDLMKDFSYVTRTATGPYVLIAHPSIPAKSVPELVALARAKPKTINYGTPGVASLGHLGMELLKMRTGTDFLHVPYKGGGPLVAAMLSGEVQIGFTSLASAIAMIQAKRLNALAVTPAKRAAALPEVPTVAESGVPGFDAAIVYGFLAPTGTPPAIVTLLNTEIRNILRMEDVKARFAAQGFEPASSTPTEFRDIVKAEIAQWARVIKDAHITVE